MIKKQLYVSLLAVVASATIVTADNIHGITMEFQSVNGLNAPDTTMYGAVGYDYRIGTKEVSVEQFQAAVGAGDGDEGYWANASRLNSLSAPAVRINFMEAAQFCNFMTSGDVNTGAYTISGGQVTDVTAHTGSEMDALVSTYGQVYLLPTENEWYKAAYYKAGSYSTYANGTSTLPVQGVDANYGPVSSAWTVGSGADEQNMTKNMMGNVWEWTESAYDKTLDLPVAENIAFRGGAYNQNGTFLSSATQGQDTYSLEHESVGMRVVAIPEPATISFMSLSSVGLFLTRTIRRRKRLGLTLIPVRREHLDTFGELQDLSAATEEESEDYLIVAMSALKDGCLNMWSIAWHSCKEFDKTFWNQMVVNHERQVAFQQAARKKVLDGLDAFLARIMN